jgi:hypothetical protein
MSALAVVMFLAPRKQLAKWLEKKA